MTKEEGNWSFSTVLSGAAAAMCFRFTMMIYIILVYVNSKKKKREYYGNSDMPLLRVERESSKSLRQLQRIAMISDEEKFLKLKPE